MNRTFPHPDEHRPHWLETPGPESDIVLGTRARLVRNLRGFPFTHLASEAQLGTIRGLLAPRLGNVLAAPTMWCRLADSGRPKAGPYPPGVGST